MPPFNLAPACQYTFEFCSTFSAQHSPTSHLFGENILAFWPTHFSSLVLSPLQQPGKWLTSSSQTPLAHVSWPQWCILRGGRTGREGVTHGGLRENMHSMTPFMRVANVQLVGSRLIMASFSLISGTLSKSASQEQSGRAEYSSTTVWVFLNKRVSTFVPLDVRGGTDGHWKRRYGTGSSTMTSYAFMFNFTTILIRPSCWLVANEISPSPQSRFLQVSANVIEWFLFSF